MRTTLLHTGTGTNVGSFVGLRCLFFKGIQSKNKSVLYLFQNRTPLQLSRCVVARWGKAFGKARVVPGIFNHYEVANTRSPGGPIIWQVFFWPQELFSYFHWFPPKIRQGVRRKHAVTAVPPPSGCPSHYGAMRSHGGSELRAVLWNNSHICLDMWGPLQKKGCNCTLLICIFWRSRSVGSGTTQTLFYSTIGLYPSRKKIQTKKYWFFVPKSWFQVFEVECFWTFPDFTGK